MFSDSLSQAETHIKPQMEGMDDFSILFLRFPFSPCNRISARSLSLSLYLSLPSYRTVSACLFTLWYLHFVFFSFCCHPIFLSFLYVALGYGEENWKEWQTNLYEKALTSTKRQAEELVRNIRPAMLKRYSGGYVVTRLDVMQP